MQDYKAIAKEILNQLGGNKFLAMTGSKNLVCDQPKGGNPYLRMNLTKNALKAKWMKIELTPSDTYTMTFLRMKRTLDKENSFPGYRCYNEEVVVIETIETVYSDMLQSIFVEKTGLYTSL